MTERKKEFIIEIEKMPSGLSEEGLEKLKEESAKEVLETTGLPPVIEEPGVTPPEAQRVWYNVRRAWRSLVTGGVSLAAILGALALASGRWAWPFYRKEREDDFKVAWGDNLESPERLQRQIETLFRAHLTREINPDNGKTWRGAFREGVVSLVRTTDALLDPEQRKGLLAQVENEKAKRIIQDLGEEELEWRELKDKLKDRGFHDPYLYLIEQLRKESKNGDGEVKKAWEQIKKRGMLMPEAVFVAAYAADVARTWKEGADKEGLLPRREFLRGFTAPHLRKAVGKAIREAMRE